MAVLKQDRSASFDQVESEGDANIRQVYVQAWEKISKRFAIDVATRLQAFDPSCHCMSAVKAQPLPV